jgi:hypothetical protein
MASKFQIWNRWRVKGLKLTFYLQQQQKLIGVRTELKNDPLANEKRDQDLIAFLAQLFAHYVQKVDEQDSWLWLQ